MKDAKKYSIVTFKASQVANIVLNNSGKMLMWRDSGSAIDFKNKRGADLDIVKYESDIITGKNN